MEAPASAAAAGEGSCSAAALSASSNVLVLGGTQFMGRLMIEQLLASGHRVTMSNRGVSANPFAGDSRVRLLQCDRMEEREKFIALISAAAAESVRSQAIALVPVCYRSILTGHL